MYAAARAAFSLGLEPEANASLREAYAIVSGIPGDRVTPHLWSTSIALLPTVNACPAGWLCLHPGFAERHDLQLLGHVLGGTPRPARRVPNPLRESPLQAMARALFLTLDQAEALFAAPVAGGPDTKWVFLARVRQGLRLAGGITPLRCAELAREAEDDEDRFCGARPRERAPLQLPGAVATRGFQ